MSKEYLSHSVEETQRFATEIVQELWPRPRRRRGKPTKKEGALVLALVGELGAGKTTFTQGVAKFLGVKQNVTSPTFLIMRRYPIENKEALPEGLRTIENLYHFDCYRVHSSEEVLALGWDNIIKNPSNLVIVEWAEKIKDIIPPRAVWVEMKTRGNEERVISIRKH